MKVTSHLRFLVLILSLIVVSCSDDSFPTDPLNNGSSSVNDSIDNGNSSGDKQTPSITLDMNSTTDEGKSTTGTVSASGGSGSDYSYYWSNYSGTLVPGSKTKTYKWPDAGSYKVTVFVRDGDGVSSDTISKTVTVKEVASADLTASLSLNDKSVKVNEEVTASANVSGGASPYTYYWSSGGSFSKGNSSYSKSWSSAGEYTIKLYVIDNDGTRSDTLEKSVSVTSSVSSNNYTMHYNITASLFWVGEGASGDNHDISNVSSAWRGDWGTQYGVEDYDGISRYSEGHDSAFIPKPHTGYTGKENAYYFALPYNDFGSLISDENYEIVHDKSLTSQNDEFSYKTSRKDVIPWADDSSNVGGWDSMVKNRWIKVTANGREVYAQWEDAGPFYYNDHPYVFGTAKQQNQKSYNNLGAGIDLSPATMYALGHVNEWDGMAKGSATVTWQFVDYADVPDGPWKRVVTTSQMGGW